LRPGRYFFPFDASDELEQKWDSQYAKHQSHVAPGFISVPKIINYRQNAQ
jgi:hypothetical protein